MDTFEAPLGWTLSVKYFLSIESLHDFWNSVAFPNESDSSIDVQEHRLRVVSVLPAIFETLITSDDGFVDFPDANIAFLLRNVRAHRDGNLMFKKKQMGDLEKELIARRCSKALEDLLVQLFSVCSLPQKLAMNQTFLGRSLFSRREMLQFIEKRDLASITHRLSRDALYAFFRKHGVLLYRASSVHFRVKPNSLRLRDGYIRGNARSCWCLSSLGSPVHRLPFAPCFTT